METSALSFARPALLHLLWLLPLLAALYWWAEQRRRAMLSRIVAPKLRALLAGNGSAARRWFRAGCVLLALALLVVTLAGPRAGYDTVETPHRGRDVIIAMDVSRSMLAPDVAPSRLQRAKLLAEDLIAELGADRIGLVAFAGSAFLQAPLTLDHGAVLAALDEMDTTVIPKGGTNIAAAIRQATEAFGKAEGFSRALVIISDGEELDADGVTAARQAAADGIRIFTVGVGSAEGSEIPLGPGEFVRDPSGKVVQSRLDAARMAEIAEAGGGFYVPLDDAAAQRLALDGIGELAEADLTSSSSRKPIERYQWPLGGAIALLVLQALVGERRRRPALVAAGLMFFASNGWSAPTGISAYESGDYETARRVFEERLRMEPSAPNLQLNAGTAAYKLKDYEKASEFFSRAMLAEDPALRSAAEFNLGNTLFRQGENQTDKEKTKTDWKDAIAKYEAALKTRPDFREAKENKERVEQLLKELEKEQEKNDKQQEKKDQQGGGQDKKEQQQGGGQQDQKEQSSGDKKDQQQQSGGEKKEEQQPSQGGQKKEEPSADGGQEQKDQQNQPQDKKDQQQSGGGKQEQQQDRSSGDEQGQKSEGKEGEQQQGGSPQDPGDQGEKGEEEGEGQDGKEPQEQAGGEEKREEQKGEGERQEQQGGTRGEPRPQQAGSGSDQPAPVPAQSGEKKEGELREAGAAGEGGTAEEQAVAAAMAEEEEEGKMSEGQARALLRSLQSEEEQVNLLERQNFQDVSRDW